MEIKYLNTFLKVCEFKSYTLAARKLGLTQPGVSKQMQRMESELGVALFDRGDHGLALTEAGRHLYQTARLFVSEWESLKNRVLPSEGPLQGTLRIGASSIPAKHFLPRILPAFHQGYPAVRVDVHCHDSEQVLEMLQQDGIDAALLGRKPESSEILSVRIAADRLVVVAGPDPCDPESWSQCPLIWREPGSGTRLAAEEALRDAGISPQGISYTFMVNDTSLILRMVRAGLGVALVSNLDAYEAVLSGGVQIVREFGARRDFYLAYPRKGQFSPLVQAFSRTVLTQMDRTIREPEDS